MHIFYQVLIGCVIFYFLFFIFIVCVCVCVCVCNLCNLNCDLFGWQQTHTTQQSKRQIKNDNKNKRYKEALLCARVLVHLKSTDAEHAKFFVALCKKVLSLEDLPHCCMAYQRLLSLVLFDMLIHTHTIHLFDM